MVVAAVVVVPAAGAAVAVVVAVARCNKIRATVVRQRQKQEHN